MDKMKLIEVDKLYINHFLRYDNKNIDKDWVIYAAVVNMCAIFSPLLFVENKIVWSVVSIAINLLLVIPLVIFLVRRDYSKKSLYLFYGIYMCIMPFSLLFASYWFLRTHFARYIIQIMVVATILIVIIGYITITIYMRRICSNYYFDKHITPPISVAVISIAVLIANVIAIDFNLMIGICLYVLGIMLSSSTYFLIKYYCYYLLDCSNK